ncbi:hypothetical protein D3C81_1531810 [compost metagenome]
MLAQIAGQTLVVPAGLPLQHAIGHWAWLLCTFTIACQHGWALNLRHAQILLRRLLGSQLGTTDLVLVVQTHTGQHSDRNRGSDSQATQAAPWTTVDLDRRGFVSQCGRDGSGDIQLWQHQFFVHGGTGNLITRPGGTGFGIIDGVQYPT